MSPGELRQVVLETLAGIAPEAELAALDDERPLRSQLELDSIDHLRFVVALHERLGVPIPETAYPELRTVAGCVRFLVRAGA